MIKIKFKIFSLGMAFCLLTNPTLGNDVCQESFSTTVGSEVTFLVTFSFF